MANSKEIDYEREVEVLLSARSINTFMASYLNGLLKSGLNEELWQEAIDDAVVASELGVDSEHDFLTFFYIDHFVEDLVKEIFGASLEKEDEEDLKKYMFSLRKEVDFNNLLSFKVAVLKWLESKGKVNKKAHPNTGKAYWSQDRYDLRKWEELAVKIAKSVAAGFSKEFALRDISASLKNPERYDFMAWFNHYTTQTINKYDVNNQIKKKNRELGMKRATLNKLGIYGDDQYYYVPTYRSPEEIEQSFKPSKKDQDAQDFESVRKKMISRVFSVDRLIEKYKNVLSDEQISGIEGTLNELKSKIRKLKMASTVKDSIVKTANILKNQFGFDSGSEILLAIAADPMVKTPAEETMVAEQTSEQKQQAALQKIMEELYQLTYAVKNRGLVRELAKVDMQLNDLRMGSFFPELQDAIGRAIEMYVYVGNKLEDVMPKIQGGLAVADLSKKIEKEPQALGEEVKDMAKNIKPIKQEEKTEPEEKMQMDVPLATR